MLTLNIQREVFCVCPGAFVLPFFRNQIFHYFLLTFSFLAVCAFHFICVASTLLILIHTDICNKFLSCQC